jgi:hypothetical protein
MHGNGEARMTNTATLLKKARIAVNAETFGTEAWESKMVVVRYLCDLIDSAKPKEEFCSVDSGFHRTRLSSGRII